MAILNWYIGVLKKYAVFTGRARRSELWYFILVHVIILLVLGVIDDAAGLVGEMGTGPLEGIYSLAVLVPYIAVLVRRMHDVGKSGWFCLIPLYNLYLAVQDSVPGANEYGPNPKTGEADLEDHLVG